MHSSPKERLPSSPYSLLKSVSENIFSHRDDIHLYLWLLKDLSWVQDWYHSGIIFGSLAILWAFFLIVTAIKSSAVNEIFVSVAIFLWIFANFWWMSADTLTYRYPDRPNHYDERTAVASNLMLAGLLWLLLLYTIIKPFRLLDWCENQKSLKKYDNSGLPPRFPGLFNSLRDYENIHIFFWLGKDFAWSEEIFSMWIIFAIPTLLISLDLVVFTFYCNQDGLLHDLAHYFAQFLWILANIVWAAGDFLYSDNDHPYALFDMSSEARRSPRWNASWLMVLALTVLVAVNLIAIYNIFSGLQDDRKTENRDRNEDDQHQRLSESTYGSFASERSAEIENEALKMRDDDCLLETESG